MAHRPFNEQGGWLYIGYNGLLAFCQWAGLGERGAIGVQIGVAALAAVALYELGRELWNRPAGLTAAGFYILDLDVARWHAYVLTDSLYMSLVIVIAWLVHRAVGRGAGAYVLACGVVVATALIRPNGWMLILIAALYWIVRSGLARRTKVIAVTLALVVCAGTAIGITARQFGGPAPKITWSAMAEPVTTHRLIFASRISLQDAFNVRRIPVRLVAELLHVRPRFSFLHNAVLIAMLAVVYPLAVIGGIRCRRHPLFLLAAGIVAGEFGLVALTFFDRDGRYLLYVFSMIVLVAACGAVSLVAERRRVA